MVAGTKGRDSFLKEIRRRFAKSDPGLAMHWDRLAAKHEVPDLEGKMPEDVGAWLDEQETAPAPEKEPEPLNPTLAEPLPPR